MTRVCHEIQVGTFYHEGGAPLGSGIWDFGSLWRVTFKRAIWHIQVGVAFFYVHIDGLKGPDKYALYSYRELGVHLLLMVGVLSHQF